MTFRRQLFAGVIAAVIATSASCTSPAEPPISDSGEIQLAVGGCYRIVTATRTYQPLSLASEFQQHGIRVKFEARLKPTVNTCMAGDVIELISIQRLP